MGLRAIAFVDTGACAPRALSSRRGCRRRRRNARHRRRRRSHPTAAGATAAATAVAATTATAAAAAEAAAATCATATAEATTTAAAGATTAAATEAARTLFTRTRLVDDDRATVERLAVHAVDGCLGFRIRAHLDEAEALRAPRVAVHHDLGRRDRAVLREGLLEVIVTDVVRQVADVKFVAHAEPLSIS